MLLRKLSNYTGIQEVGNLSFGYSLCLEFQAIGAQTISQTSGFFIFATLAHFVNSVVGLHSFSNRDFLCT